MGAHSFGIILFVAIVAATIYITLWAAKRNKSTSDFYTAGRSLTGWQNGLAISGDYLSAASFLGIAGLVALNGYDGFLYAVGWMVGYVIVLYVVAEPLRNSGKFTVADVLASRLKERPIRMMTATVTLVVTLFYMVAQMVGAGGIIQLLVGIPYEISVILIGALMILYVMLGGMLATSWVQIIKAVLLMFATLILVLFVAMIFKFNISGLFGEVVASNGAEFLSPGLLYKNPVDLLSLGMALILGTAGLPHILIRFYTVPSAQEARKSVIWAMILIGVFYIMIALVGFAASVLVGPDAIRAADQGGNMAAPLLAQFIGGGEGTLGGEIFMSLISAVSFATIVAVVAGLVIAGSGAFAHDIYTNVIKRGKVDSKKQFKVARNTALAIGAISIALGIVAKGMNVAYLVVLAFAVGASANLPVIIFSLYWRRFNTAGAIAGMLAGMVSAVTLVFIGPSVMGENAIFPLANPGIISIPLGFLTSIVVTLITKPESSAEKFDELDVKSNTGLGAEM
ncbi:cation acetate symporter [Siminovitchia sp. FSL H7-0308]|uniref:Cation/acetate symporter n=1 Tax=Siminovitchia thermophila TaxID=1245522 RepID=A0ABS2RD13_9BACI|nr:cation acetate symporter [Siminovitchia thermophila]MBM7717464.1 cation/acetate symporter [Siminovitchia thermophila]ONK22318.1 cation acetate symporter [Bacillus sp. VT-16-64]